MNLEKRIYGQVPNGQDVVAYVMQNDQGMSVELLNYGGLITQIVVPDQKDKRQNIVLGYNSLSSYLENKPYFGALVGRYANRIATGNFNLKKKNYQISINHGRHHLHGGFVGYDKVMWDSETLNDPRSLAVKLSYLSPHLEEGFPGNLMLTVTYRLTDDNQFHIHYEAQTDQATPINLTQHSYFNLSGNPDQSILDHILEIQADLFLETNKELIPTGKLLSVQNTPLDFRIPKPLGEDIMRSDSFLKTMVGYDHCYAFAQKKGTLKQAARLVHPTSGRVLEVKTDTPGMQLYTPRQLAPPFVNYGGVCLETQFFPDSPNQSDFPSTILLPGKIFSSETQYNFSVL